MSEWGRVSDDGTVYVRTSDGERAVGTWLAGTPEEGLAHFARRYEQIATEVTLLEARLRSGAGDPRQVATSAERLRDNLPSAAAVGDLDSLGRRIDGLLEKTSAAVTEHQAVRAAQKEQAVLELQKLAEEAESLALSSAWKDAGDRLRAMGQEWKRVTGVDKKTADALWERVAQSRATFTERRGAHFDALQSQRTISQERKEKLVKEAEKLSASTDFKGTAERFKQLMTEWKAAGRAPREVDDELWAAFKAAQDTFFAARNSTFAEKDSELRANQTVKEAILAEAEALAVPAGKSRLRQLQEKWDAAGKVPREVMRSLEDRFAKVEERFRDGADTTHVKASESPFVVRLREKIADLEKKLASAQAAGRPTDDLQAQLQTQRGWLAQAGGTTEAPAAVAAADAPSAAPKKPTTAWVRAEG